MRDLLDSIQYADVNRWEQCRFNAYILAQINSKKKIKPTDLLSFAWDKKEKQIDLNNEKEVNDMKEKMRAMEKFIKGDNGINTENNP